MHPPVEPNEPARLAALKSLSVLDTSCEDRFDRVVTFAAHHFNVPIALISLIDEKRQWFKSRVGIDASETSRDISICAHGIHQHDRFVITDLTQDKRFAANPLVTGEPNARFYAGMPLVLGSGLVVGMFCLIDTTPRALSEPEYEQFACLRDVIVAELELTGGNAAPTFH